MSRNKSSLWSILLWILLALLAIGAVVMLLKFTNGGNEDFKTFYVTYNGKMITASESNMALEGGEHKFGVKYTFDLASDPKDFDVYVAANPDSNFEFMTDDFTRGWRSEQDLGEIFGLKKESDGFSITIPEKFTVYSALQTLYPNQVITVPETELPKYLYTIVVSSYNEKVVYHLNFWIPSGNAELLLPESVVF